MSDLFRNATWGDEEEEPQGGGNLFDGARWGDSVSPQETPPTTVTSPDGESKKLSTLDQLRALPEFHRLVRMQTRLQRATIDPSAGDWNELMNQIEDLTAQVKSKVEISDQALREAVLTLSEDVNIDETPPGLQLAENTLRSGISVFEMIQPLGDTTRSFGVNLLEQQAARDLESGNLPPEFRSGGGGRGTTATQSAIDELIEAGYTGNPNPNPLGAALDVGRAAASTVEEMGWLKSPITRNEEGELQGNRESGWFVYAPNVHWGGQSYGVTPYEAELAPTGREFNAKFRIDERFGIESEFGKEMLGLATEVILDPLVAADWLTVGARGSRILGKATGSQALEATATSLDNAADDFYRAVSPAGMFKTGRDAANALSLGVVENVERMVMNGANRILDIPVPWARYALPAEQRAARGSLGFRDREIVPRLRDVFLQGGRGEWLQGGPLEFLAGSDRYGPGIGALAMGKQRELGRIGLRASREIGEALTEGLRTKVSARLPHHRIAVPNARTIDPEKAPYVRGLGTIVSDYVDTTPIFSTKIPKAFEERLQALSELYGEPIADTLSRFKNANRAARKAVLQVGYQVSGYPDFVRAMMTVANREGVDYGDLRRWYEYQLGGVDLQTIELRREGLPFVDTSRTQPVPYTRERGRAARELGEEMEFLGVSVDDWTAKIHEELKRRGRGDLTLVSPQQYLESLRTGYFRRMFHGVENPERAIEAISSRSLIVARRYDPDELVSRFSRYGEGAEEAVRRFLAVNQPVTPRNMTPEDAGDIATVFSGEDLAKVLTRVSDRRVTPEEIGDILYPKGSDNASYLRETLDILKEYARKGGPTAPGMENGVGWGMNPADFQIREGLTLEQLASRIQIRDPSRQAAELALRGGRRVRSQEFLGMAYDELSDLDMLITPDKAKTIGEPGADYIFPFQQGSSQGERYVVLPKSKKVWGPLAGHAVPEVAARQFVTALTYGSRSRGDYERLLSMWRRQRLAPLSTSLRNVTGNFILLNQAGVPFPEMMQNLPRANRIRSQFLKDGTLPEEFKGYEHLFQFITEDSTRVSTAVDSVTDVLEDAARGDVPWTSVLDEAEALTKWSTETAPIGFLGFFKWGEETSRMTAFITTYDGLIQRGVDHHDAMHRAAHVAANAAYNYGMAPLFPEALRRTGLSAFPQFAYFTVGRTARTLVENPQPLARLQYGREAVNTAAFEGDLTEQERVTYMSSDWLRYNHPLAIPIPNQDGDHYVIDGAYLLPQGATLQDIISDPATGGIASPWIDAMAAWASGEDYGPFGARFGERIRRASDPASLQVRNTAGYLLEQYAAPGIWRDVGRFREAVTYNENKEVMDLMGLIQGRHTNSTWEQLFGRLIGINARRVDTLTGGLSYRTRMRELYFKYQSRLDDLMERYTDAVQGFPADDQSGRVEDPEQLMKRYMELQDEYIQETLRLQEMSR